MDVLQRGEDGVAGRQRQVALLPAVPPISPQHKGPGGGIGIGYCSTGSLPGLPDFHHMALWCTASTALWLGSLVPGHWGTYGASLVAQRQGHCSPDPHPSSLHKSD